MPNIVIYADGGARGNPGPAAAGVVIKEAGRTIAGVKKFLGEKVTNNAAEYSALALALSEAKIRGLAQRHIEVRMDSELIVRQMRSEYRVKEQSLWPLYMHVHNLLVGDFTHVRFVHVPRSQNAEADRLVNEALDDRA